MAKHVKFSLFDQKSLDAAVQRIDKLYERFDWCSRQVLIELADYGVEYAQQRLLAYGAIDTETLYDSIQPGDNIHETGKAYVTKVIAMAPYAAYVEYGTGIVGLKNSHPNPDGWAYDINSHGEAGWNYYDRVRGGWRWTMGQPARPFMHDTKLHLEQLAPKLAVKIYKKL